MVGGRRAYHDGTASGQFQRDGLADTPGRAGDQCSLALQFHGYPCVSVSMRQ